MAEKQFEFGEGGTPQETQRSQLQYPLDAESEGAVKLSLEKTIKDIVINHNRISLTLASGATSFAVASNYMVMTGAAAVTIATIVGGREGMILTLEFIDTNVTITDTSTGAVDTVNLQSTFVSAANGILELQHNGISWREVARSTINTHTHASSTTGGTIDHGAITGLTDDDHTQYVLEALLDAKGDIYGATADNTPARLAVGINGTVLTAASGQATGLSWATPITVAFAAGQESINVSVTDDITIAHGLGKTPDLVTIMAMCNPATNELASSWGSGTATGSEQSVNNSWGTATVTNTSSSTSSIVILRAAGGTAFDADLKTLDGTNIVLNVTTNSGDGGARVLVWQAHASE